MKQVWALVRRMRGSKLSRILTIALGVFTMMVALFWAALAGNAMAHGHDTFIRFMWTAMLFGALAIGVMA